MKAAAVILLLAFACAAPPAATAQRRAHAAKVQARGRNILLTERGARTLIRVAEYVDAARVTDASVVFESRDGVYVYLLLDVCGPSKERPDDRQCGAGVECNLLWLKLDSRRRVIDADSARYESCWAPITTEEGYRVTGGTLRLVVQDLREQLEHTITYDADRPARGLQRQQSPLKSGDR